MASLLKKSSASKTEAAQTLEAVSAILRTAKVEKAKPDRTHLHRWSKIWQYQTTVSVIISVYNGEAFIGAKLESILGLEYPPRAG